MESVTILLGVVAAAAVGVVAWLLVGRSGLQAEREGAERRASVVEAESKAKLDAAARIESELRVRLAESQEREGVLAGEVGVLRQERTSLSEREAALVREKAAALEQIAEVKAQLRDTFRSLAAQALDESTKALLRQSEEKFKAQQSEAHAAVTSLVRPIAESLKEAREKIGLIEQDRARSFGDLNRGISDLLRESGTLRERTDQLVQTLRRPEVRGAYGEIQLQRVVELAGMRNYCDFTPQESVRDADGNIQRPDLIVKLPNDRCIVVDAKTNIHAYMQAAEAAGADEREECLCRFADHVADQASALAKKKYYTNYDGTPDFTVMFIPGDQFVDAALQRRPDLLDIAAQQGVILASPSTLIGLLRAVAVGWRHKQVEEQANELLKLGRELHDRAATAWEHLADLGGAVGKVVDKYNKVVGSVESRLTPTLRRFEEAGITSAQKLPGLEAVTVTPRKMLLLNDAAPAESASS